MNISSWGNHPQPWNALNGCDSSHRAAASHAATTQVKLKTWHLQQFLNKVSVLERNDTYFYAELKQTVWIFLFIKRWLMIYDDCEVFFFCITVTFIAQVDPQWSHITFGYHSPVSIVIWNCSAEVIHHQRAFVRSHSCWYFTRSADMEQSFCLLPTLPACPIQSSQRSVQRYILRPRPPSHTCTTIHTYSTFIHYLYPSFVFLSYGLQSGIKLISLWFKGHNDLDLNLNS